MDVEILEALDSRLLAFSLNTPQRDWTVVCTAYPYPEMIAGISLLDTSMDSNEIEIGHYASANRLEALDSRLVSLSWGLSRGAFAEAALFSFNTPASVLC